MGIGTTAPDSNSKLDVRGHIKTTGNLTLDGSYINLNTPITTGGWARGFLNIDTDKVTRIGGVGLLGSKDQPNYYYMAHGKTPWSSGLGIYVKTNGNVGIRTMQPDMELTVNGKIHAKEVKIDLAVPAPDYVFKSDYKLRSIEEVESFIKKNSHLPEIPSAKEFAENGVLQAEMDMNLLKKIEELTLYTIEQEKKLKTQKEIVEQQQEEIEELKKQNSEIKELKALVQKLIKDKN